MDETPRTLDYAASRDDDYQRLRTLSNSLNVLTVGVLVLIGADLLFIFGPLAFLVIIVATIIVLVSFLTALREMGVSTPARVALCLLLFVPVLNLIVLGIVVLKIIDRLRRAGIRVGTFGVDRHELDRFMNERAES